jgi:hypothetical protein
VFSFGVVMWEAMTLKEPWRCAAAVVIFLLQFYFVF